MPKRSRTAEAEAILKQFAAAGFQIIPHGHDASIRGPFDVKDHKFLMKLLPEVSHHWREIVEVLASRDENEAAEATLSILTAESERTAAATTLGRLGGLKGGKARAASLTKKRRAQIATKAARARWRKR